VIHGSDVLLTDLGAWAVLVAYMLFAKVTDAAYPHLTSVYGIFHSPPALQPVPLPTIRTMQEEEINIPETTLLHAPRNTLPRSLIIRITRKLGRVMYILSLELRMRVEEVQNRGTDLLLITIHLSRVYGSVTGFESVFDGIVGFGPGHEVHPKMDVGHGEAIVQLDARGKSDRLVGHSALHGEAVNARSASCDFFGHVGNVCLLQSRPPW